MSEFWSTAEERVVTHKSSFFEIENEWIIIEFLIKRLKTINLSL